MKAWQYTGVNEPLVHNDVPEPEPGPGDVVLDIKAAGLCHSDIGYLDGTISGVVAFAPMTLGHEIAGVVSAVGEGVTRLRVGDRVVSKADMTGPGQVRHGGFAERVAVQQELVSLLPDGVAWDQGAVSTDAGMTSFHAVTVRGGVRAGHRVGIIGFGGLGSLGAQVAVSVGADVFVAEPNDELRARVAETGAVASGPSVESFRGLGLDVIVDFAGYGTTTAGAIAVVRDGGRVVQVGLGVPESTINTFDLTVREIELLGSLGGVVDDNERVLELMAAGTLHSHTELVSFDEIGDAIERLRRHENTGRLVAVRD
jgi:alcohol dehydrogenase, propanol-preferring